MNKKVKKTAVKKAVQKKAVPAKKSVAKIKVAKPTKDTAKNKKPSKPTKWEATRPAPKKLPAVKAQKIKSVAKPTEKKEVVKKLAPISIEIVDYASKGLAAQKPVEVSAKLDTRPIIPSSSAVEMANHEPTVAEVHAQLMASRRNTLGSFTGFSPVAL